MIWIILIILSSLNLALSIYLIFLRTSKWIKFRKKLSSEGRIFQKYPIKYTVIENYNSEPKIGVEKWI